MENFELTDEEYELIEPLLPSERPNKYGRSYKANRPIINGILWILYTGGSWKKLPKYYGAKSTINDRFLLWKKNGVWQEIHKILKVKRETRPIKKVKKNEAISTKNPKKPKVQTIDNKLTKLDVDNWINQGLEEIKIRLNGYFARLEMKKKAIEYIQGLLSITERKNGWQLAETIGDKNPYAIQYLLSRARWNADEVCNELCKYTIDNLADKEAVLVVDETGFVKKGTHSAGVGYQYTGSAGGVANCQIGVFVAYASEKGHVLIDRELYLPKEWIDDPERCEKVGIPSEQTFTTKPELACVMFERIFASGIPAKWVTGDSVYGNNRCLRTWLEQREKSYVLSVNRQEYVWIAAEQIQVSKILDSMLVDDEWLRLSAGNGSKGPRYYDWQWLPLESAPSSTMNRWLLIRRNIRKHEELRAYIVFADKKTSLDEVVKVAGTRWTVEICFEATKGEVGLDHYEVRSWNGWYRHITLSMWAHAFLTVIKSFHSEDFCLKKKSISKNMTQFKKQRNLL